MSSSLPDLDIKHLSVPQRLDLIGLLWDSIPNSVEAMNVPDWHAEEIERRLASADANPESAIPWEEVKLRLRGKS